MAQIATVDALSSSAQASGGKGNPAHVHWEDIKEVHFRLLNGVVSPLGLAVMANANLVDRDGELSKVEVPRYEEKVPASDGVANLSFPPILDCPFFVSGMKEGNVVSVEDYTLSGKQLTAKGYDKLFVDYYYTSTSPSKTIEIGENLFNGYLTVEGETTFVDSETGAKSTSIFTIPRARISTSFNLRLGRKAEPIVSTLNIVGYPQKGVAPFTWVLFEDDIGGDI